MYTHLNIAENPLFPVFMKLHNLHLLVVGGGYVGKEKLDAVLANSPRAKIRLVAKEASKQVRELIADYPNITFIEAAFEPAHLEDIDLVICGIDEPEVSEQIRAITRQARILSNFADKPGLCDFYLGSVVHKGQVKIAISTNGKSPTLAKRIKEILNDGLPDNIHSLLDNLSTIREGITGDISKKIKILDQATLAYRKNGSAGTLRKCLRAAAFLMAVLATMFAGHLLFSAMKIDATGQSTQAPIENQSDQPQSAAMFLNP
jgi:siroheme synthase-like protein